MRLDQYCRTSFHDCLSNKASSVQLSGLAASPRVDIFFPQLVFVLFCFQSDVIHQSVFELIHTDDRALFRSQLHFAFNPTNGQQDGSCDSPSMSTVPVLHLCLCQGG